MSDSPEIQAYKAAVGGQYWLLEPLLESGVNPDFKHPQTKLRLLTAAFEATEPEMRRKCIRLLLDHGADPKLSIDIRGYNNILHQCCAAGFGEEAVIVMERGLDPNMRDAQGVKAVQHLKPEFSMEMEALAKELVYYGADIGPGLPMVFDASSIQDIYYPRASMMRNAEAGTLSLSYYTTGHRETKIITQLLSKGYKHLLHPRCWAGGTAEAWKAFETLIPTETKPRIDLTVILREYPLAQPDTHVAGYATGAVLQAPDLKH